MIGTFFLGIVVLGIVILLIRWFVDADPKAVARGLKISAVVLGGALLIYIFISGVYRLLPFLLMTALPWILEGRFNIRKPGGRPSRGQSSEVETGYLRMTLDHDSGEMEGEVLDGQFKGRKISDLSLEETAELLHECLAEDPNGAAVVEAWLDRIYGPDWREAADMPEGKSGGAMTEAEALDILGLEAGATKDEIEAAWRAQMSKNHPDAGGSTWIAARINAAREFLLGKS